MDYVTIERVPLMRVGTWNASTGTTSISREDIDNILASFNAGVDPAVIKIGHVDPRFANPEWMDGEPAYGQVTNLSVDDELGGTLYGDYVNVPKELAERMDSAYPFRSVEISWGVQMLDAEGEVTAEYPAVLTALALLGEAPPAVQGLGTVHATFSQRGKTKTTVFTASAFTFAGGHTQDSLRRALQKALEAGGAYDRWVRDFDDSLVWFESEAGLQQVAFLTAPDG
ncbi:hypothetical protein ACMX2H_18535, partial [Arthrobacter sulfonylureivorans]|uniref:hypothetical protein n=1 Tax=Arthrobacter sulfonylureivorans TaxID=2486855 RepID=UPI0039E2F728